MPQYAYGYRENPDRQNNGRAAIRLYDLRLLREAVVTVEDINLAWHIPLLARNINPATIAGIRIGVVPTYQDGVLVVTSLTVSHNGIQTALPPDLVRTLLATVRRRDRDSSRKAIPIIIDAGWAGGDKGSMPEGDPDNE